MSTDPRAQLAELRRLSMSDLKERWRDLIGTDPPQYSRSFLVSRLAYRIQELAYGGLRPSAIADQDMAARADGLPRTHGPAGAHADPALGETPDPPCLEMRGSA